MDASLQPILEVRRLTDWCSASWCIRCTQQGSGRRRRCKDCAAKKNSQNGGTHNKLCRRPPKYTPAPASWPLTFWPWKWCPSHVGYHCVKFSFPRPLCSRFRPDVRDRQTSDRLTSDKHRRLMPPSRWGRGIIMEEVVQLPVFVFTNNPSIVNGLVENMHVDK